MESYQNTETAVTYVEVVLSSMECVRSGHVGGVNNEKYLHENEIYFPKEHRFIVLLLQHGRCEHTLYLRSVMPLKCDLMYSNNSVI